jgi:outer membrane lipoprotein-sorting protein
MYLSLFTLLLPPARERRFYLTCRACLACRWMALAAAAMLGMAASARGEDLAQSILKRADETRFPAHGFEVTVSIASSDGGKPVESRVYKVLSKDNENTIVMIIKPASERGQIMLMKGRDLWLFLPAVTQPVRLSLAQRLTGQVANGDIARANFTGDYVPKVAGTEQIDGENYHVLDLAAVDRGVTYPRVRYWVRQRNAWPYKAEFYSLSDRLLKTCRYERFVESAGAVRPTRMVMTDALRQSEVSVMDYTDLKPKSFPDKIFTKEYLKKLD